MPPDAAPPTSSHRRRLIAPGLLLVVCGLVGLPPLFAWQRASRQRAESLSNIRRIATGALLYAQDWDSRLPPLAQRDPDGSWHAWPERLRPYVAPDSTFDNPANSLAEAGRSLHHPTLGYPITSAYALNRRFQDTFAPGPFPVDNLELPGQTALFVEAGPMWPSPTRPPRSGALSPFALLDYGDMLDRVNGLCPYPSPHEGRILAAAADGHAILLKVEHYTSAQGQHDPLYGRIGGSLYNWNGGHPNGETDRPPRE